MTEVRQPPHRGLPRLAKGTGLAAAAALALAACGSSSSTKTTASATTAPAAVTISAAAVPGVGTVLVDGTGKTLYLLTSEKGGKITCTDANGCTKVWPDLSLPTGVRAATAGPGAVASMLGTTKNAAGEVYPTYAGYPLYEYSGDTASGTAHGQGIVSFGGTWETLKPDGTPVTTPKASATTTSAY